MTDPSIRTMTITIERIPRTLAFGTAILSVEELGTRLPFARKPVTLSEVGGCGLLKVYVTETRFLTPDEFDALARNLLASRDWLRAKGGSVADGYLCVEVAAPDRPYLYINPEGSDYGRFVARLG